MNRVQAWLRRAKQEGAEDVEEKKEGWWNWTRWKRSEGVENKDPFVSKYTEGLDREEEGTTETKDQACKEHVESVRKILKAKPRDVLSATGKRHGTINPSSRERKLVKDAHLRGLFLPWSVGYRMWWLTTVAGAALTSLTLPYEIAFTNEPGLAPYDGPLAIIEYILSFMFFIDILVNFNLAMYRHEVLVYERKLIAWYYLKGMFWIDITGVFPFDVIALAATGQLGDNNSTLAEYLSLLRLARMVRLYRLEELFQLLQRNHHLSISVVTMLRNFVVVVLVCHLAACGLYFIAKQYDFSDDTWIGPELTSLPGLNGFERYLTSFYWAIVTFTTVGYGDFSPVNLAEQIWGIVYMLLNIILMAYIIGSITLLVVKSDESTGAFRDASASMKAYCGLHGLESSIQTSMQSHLKIEFNNKEISDDSVLQHFPRVMRKKILRRIYLSHLLKMPFMRGIRQHFLDAFLCACTVEIFMPGVHIVQQGTTATELYLLVGGFGEILMAEDSTNNDVDDNDAQDNGKPPADDFLLEAGSFIGDVAFFSNSLHVDTVESITICKTLCISKEDFDKISSRHPGSSGKLLENVRLYMQDLLASEPVHHKEKITPQEEMRQPSFGASFVHSESTGSKPVSMADRWTMLQDRYEKLQEVCAAHKLQYQEDLTVQFLYCAARGDVNTMRTMLMRGFKANCKDYDRRTALMVACSKGQVEVVRLLLDAGVNLNARDKTGTTALYESVKSGKKEITDMLVAAGAKLSIDSAEHTASALCNAVHDGNYEFLRDMLEAGVDASCFDYDRRTPLHIACAEGRLDMVKLLVEKGADMDAKDRWDHTPMDDAKSHQRPEVAKFLSEARRDRG